MKDTGCRVAPGLSAEGRAVKVRQEVLATMEILECRKNEARDKVEKNVRGLLTSHDHYLVAARYEYCGR